MSVRKTSHGQLEAIPRVGRQPCCFTIPRPGTVLDDDCLHRGQVPADDPLRVDSTDSAPDVVETSWGNAIKGQVVQRDAAFIMGAEMGAEELHGMNT